jgi:hypothetical protein
LTLYKKDPKSNTTIDSIISSYKNSQVSISISQKELVEDFEACLFFDETIFPNDEYANFIKNVEDLSNAYEQKLLDNFEENYKHIETLLIHKNKILNRSIDYGIIQQDDTIFTSIFNNITLKSEQDKIITQLPQLSASLPLA